MSSLAARTKSRRVPLIEFPIGPRLRSKRFYSVERAGALAGMSRSGSYRAAQAGLMPLVRLSPVRFAVDRQKWDRELKRALKQAR
jgi:hypothetical protein